MNFGNADKHIQHIPGEASVTLEAEDGLGYMSLSDLVVQAMGRVFWIFCIVLLFISGMTWLLIAVFPLDVLCWQLWNRSVDTSLAGRTTQETISGCCNLDQGYFRDQRNRCLG